MFYRKLGRSGLKVSPLCLGAMMFGGPTDAATAERIIAIATDAGLNVIEISVLSAGGRKLGLAIMTPGEIFGEIGLFAGRRTASATAIGQARLRAVRRADLLAAIHTEPDLALQFIDLLCERLRIVSEKLEDRWFLPLPTRLARRLLHLAEKLGAADGRIPVSQTDLADFAGATRESVARALAVWRDQGWVKLSRGAIRILNKEALAALAATEDE